MITERVKRLLGVGDERDEIISEIVSLTSSRLMVLIGADEIPESLEYIVVEVSVIRYNRIGSEGASSHNVGGETRSFYDSDFEPYMEDISAYHVDSGTGRRKVFFY